MRDNYDREIDTMRVSVTSLCNLRCSYCNPKAGNSDKKSGIITRDKILNIIKSGSKLGIKRIKFTGGEPLLRSDIGEIIEAAKQISGIEDVSITTNGVFLTDMLDKLKKSGLDRINISLDTLEREKYSEITEFDKIDKVKSGIIAACGYGFKQIKINTVLLGDLNSYEIPLIKDFASQYGAFHQVINIMDLKDSKHLSENFENTDKPPHCSKCSRIRLSSDGKLLPCLFSDIIVEPDDYKDYDEAIISCINSKPFEGARAVERGMVEIGG